MCGMREFDLEAISDEVKQQLRVIYGHLMKTPKVMVVRVQQLQGTMDCGLCDHVCCEPGHWKRSGKSKVQRAASVRDHSLWTALRRDALIPFPLLRK